MGKERNDIVFPFSDGSHKSLLFSVDIKEAKPYRIYLQDEEFYLVSEELKNEYQQIEKTGDKLFDAGQLLQRLIDKDILHWFENPAKLEFIKNELSVSFDPTTFCTWSVIKIQENKNNLFFVKNGGFLRDDEKIGFFKIKEDELHKAIAQEIILSRRNIMEANKIPDGYY